MLPARQILFALASTCLCAASASSQVLERVDLNSQGQVANLGAGLGDLSSDGRLVAFTSSSTNLGGPTMPIPQVYLRDRVAGTTVAITAIPSFGVDQLVGDAPHISGDGTKILYSRGDPSIGTCRSYVYDRIAGGTNEILIPGVFNLLADAISSTGRFVLLTSNPISSSGRRVYRVDLQTGSSTLVSRDPSGAAVDGIGTSMDGSGDRIAFLSSSSRVVPGDTNNLLDVFVFEVSTGSMTRASVATSGTQSNGQSFYARISGDGRWVCFASQASNLVFADTNGVVDVFLHDMQTGLTERVSLTSVQEQMHATAAGTIPCLSLDGSTIAFASAEPVNPNDGTASQDTYWLDRVTGVVLPVSFGSPLAIDWSLPRALSQDGRELLTSIVLVPTPSPGVQQSGLFIAKLGPSCSTSGYCTSLPNSTGEAATINVQGDASRTLNSMVVYAVGLPDTAISMIVSGTASVDPGTPFGNGLLCVGGSLIRHGIFVADGGLIIDAQDLLSPEYAAVQPGDTRYYQVFYRDPPAGGALFNTTDAMAVTFCW